MHLITLQLTLPLPPPPTPPNIVCVLINFMYWLVGRVLGGMVSANVKKKKKEAKINFWQHSNISYCA